MPGTALVRFGEAVASETVNARTEYPAAPWWVWLLVAIGFVAFTKAKGTRRWD